MDFDVSNFDPSGIVKGSIPYLTQAQADETKCDSANPPTFHETVLDAETGERIVWRARSPDEKPLVRPASNESR